MLPDVRARAGHGQDSRTPIDQSDRSFALSSVGGWLGILGLAVVLGPHDVYPVGSPIPLVNGLRLTILPAPAITAIDLGGHLLIVAGVLLVVVAAARRARARRDSLR